MSKITFCTGAAEKSGPVEVILANGIAKAIMMPPQAMKGMAYETPVSRCWRNFLSLSSIGPFRSCAILPESVFTCNVVAIFVYAHHDRRVGLASRLTLKSRQIAAPIPSEGKLQITSSIRLEKRCSRNLHLFPRVEL